jgi:hypothetical protein
MLTKFKNVFQKIIQKFLYQIKGRKIVGTDEKGNIYYIQYQDE